MNTPGHTLLDYIYNRATNEHKRILCHGLSYFRQDLKQELLASPPLDSDQRKLVIDQWIDRLKAIGLALKKFPMFKEDSKRNTSRFARVTGHSLSDIASTSNSAVAGQSSALAVAYSVSSNHTASEAIEDDEPAKRSMTANFCACKEISRNV